MGWRDNLLLSRADLFSYLAGQRVAAVRSARPHGVGEQDLSWISPCPSACSRLLLIGWMGSDLQPPFSIFSEMGFQVLVYL